MESKNKNVINIGRNDRDALAKEVGMTEFDNSTKQEAHAVQSERTPGRVLTALGATATVLGTAWLAAPRSHDAPQPDEHKSFAEQVAESARQPYDPAKDDLVIGNIRVKAGDPNRDTMSEAVLNDGRVKVFEKAHPNEVSSITTSAMSSPGGKKAGIVMRDVDHDGDKDAIAVEIKDK